MRGWAVAIGVGHASHEECDTLGMTAAQRTAGHRALAQLAAQGYEPDRVILDGNHDYLQLGARCTTVIKGDATSLAVAAASVVAKVTRDAMMAEEAEHFPAFGFESNRGYPAPVHKAALDAWGPTTIHRRSWIFMDGLVLGRARARARPLVLEAGDRRRPHGRRSARSARRGARRDTGVSSPASATDQWDDPTPCDDWDVRTLVNHIVTGNFWAAELGAGQDDRGGGRPPRRRRARTTTRSAPTTLGRGGRGGVPPRPARWKRRARSRTARSRARCTAGTGSIDVLIHGWDVATATGQDATTPAELVEACFEVVEPQAELLAASGMFGTDVDAAAGGRPPDPAARHPRSPTLSRRNFSAHGSRDHRHRPRRRVAGRPDVRPQPVAHRHGDREVRVGRAGRVARRPSAGRARAAAARSRRDARDRVLERRRRSRRRPAQWAELEPKATFLIEHLFEYYGDDAGWSYEARGVEAPPPIDPT